MEVQTTPSVEFELRGNCMRHWQWGDRCTCLQVRFHWHFSFTSICREKCLLVIFWCI